MRLWIVTALVKPPEETTMVPNRVKESHILTRLPHMATQTLPTKPLPARLHRSVEASIDRQDLVLYQKLAGLAKWTERESLNLGVVGLSFMLGEMWRHHTKMCDSQTLKCQHRKFTDG